MCIRDSSQANESEAVPTYEVSSLHQIMPALAA